MLADLVVLLAVGLYTNLDEKGTEAMRATVQLLLVVGLYTNLDEKGTEAIRATVQLPGVDSPCPQTRLASATPRTPGQKTGA